VTRSCKTRNPLLEACRQINSAGLLIYADLSSASMENALAPATDSSFVEESSIPQPMLGILQALPNTALWNRLTAEQRLLEGVGITEVGDQNTLMNFTPTRQLRRLLESM